MEFARKNFPNGFPTLKELKEINKGKDVPPETAWIWGEDDEIGRLNLLTPSLIRSVKDKEVKDGSVVSLNWSIDLPKQPAFGRQPCKHTIAHVPESEYVFDDWLDMNIQSGSQWDGFRHYGHLTAKILYNNLRAEEVLSGTRCGMQAIAKRGIVGRGVLLDYYSWAHENNKPYDPLSSHSISVSELEAVAASQNLTFETGDILLIRSGYTSTYNTLSTTDPSRLAAAGVAVPNLAGVEQSEEMKEWLHDHYFAAVGGDAPAFEVWPGKEWKLHEYLLACWGVLIGEMFDLEALAQQCKEKKRWSFLFMSAPINSPGGVASLANALAIH